MMMKSYELGQSASSEKPESPENPGISENIEAAELDAFMKTADLSAEAVVDGEEPISENLTKDETPDNSDTKLTGEPEAKTISQESQSSDAEKTSDTVNEAANSNETFILTDTDSHAQVTSKDTEDPIAQEDEQKPLNESIPVDEPVSSIEKAVEEVEAEIITAPLLIPTETAEKSVSETEAEIVTKKKPGKSGKSVQKNEVLADHEELTQKETVIEDESTADLTSEVIVESLNEKQISAEESISFVSDEMHGEDVEITSETESDFDEAAVHDYSSYSKVQLISTLRKLIEENPVEEIRRQVEAIKASFYKLRNAEIQELKQAFLAEGNEEVLFEPETDPAESELKDLLKEYKNLRAEINKKQDNIKEENYQKKLAIIDEIKSLINSEESLNITFQEFNDLQERWRNIGQVPQNKVKDLWENYHYHVELFYDYVKINRELRDLDLRRNLELKQDLCKKAEDLSSNNSDSLSSFKELQKLHESWREIGPVPRENKQELWERFKSATSVINKRYQQFFEHERALQREQLQRKIELCELAEVYAGFESDNPREWNDVTDKVIALQEEWKKSGFGPRKENLKIWERFRSANDAFFQNKRNFWNRSKEQLNKNLALKLEICEQAEKLKDSDDWKATSDKLITLQKKWKDVGPVPRKQSEMIWKKFRTACDEFFNRKTQHFSGVTGDQDENYNAKTALLSEIESFSPSGDTKENIAALKKFQERWSEIGFVPFRKKEELQKRYHDLIEAQFDKLKLDDHEVMLYKFKSKIEHWASVPGGWGKINTERDRCAQHLKQLENDMNTLANNVGFFGSSKGAQSLIQGVNAQIEKIRSQIEYLKAKIKIVDEQDEVN